MLFSFTDTQTLLSFSEKYGYTGITSGNLNSVKGCSYDITGSNINSKRIIYLTYHVSESFQNIFTGKEG